MLRCGTWSHTFDSPWITRPTKTYGAKVQCVESAALRKHGEKVVWISEKVGRCHEQYDQQVWSAAAGRVSTQGKSYPTSLLYN